MALPSPKRQRGNDDMLTTIANSTHEYENAVSAKTWSNTPADILSKIADHLGIIELLSFRGACKDWCSASSSALVQIESSANDNPWFILCGENSQCCLYITMEKRKYTINIPELDGAYCLASNDGWLLLFCGGSIFFFCPFSRSRIDLPRFPHSEFSDYVGAFSSPPTSLDCVVCVINRCDESTLELNLLFRGDAAWTKSEKKYNRNYLDAVICATYEDGKFHFMDDKDHKLTYNVKNTITTSYTLVDSSYPDCEPLEFIYQSNYFTKNGIWKLMELEEDISVSTCGTQISGNDLDIVISNENIKALDESRTRNLRGIWIQPRFHRNPPNQSWSFSN